MKMIKKINFLLIPAFLINILFCSLCSGLFVGAASYNPNLTLTGKNILLYNEESDLIVYEQNADERFDPIGLTQIMTTILAIEKTDIDKEKATAKAYIFDDLFGNNFPTADVKRGETLTIRELIACMQLQCSYEAAAVVADYISDGSYAYFAEMMNKKAKEIGCTETNFVNPFGAPNPNQYTTAKDILQIARYAMGLPVYAELAMKSRYSIEANNLHTEPRLLVATNKMIDPSSSPDYFYDRAIGVKTAGLMTSGRCGVLAAKYNGLTYYCVIAGSPVKNEKDEYIAKNGVITDAKALFKWAYSSFSVKNLLETEAPCGQIKLNLSSEKDYLLLYPKDKFTSLVFNEVDQTSVLLEKIIPENIDAPIHEGQEIGYANLLLAGEVIGTIPLIAKENIQRNMVLYVAKVVKDIFSTGWTIVVIIILVILLIGYIIYSIIHNRNKRRKIAYRNGNKFKMK